MAKRKTDVQPTDKVKEFGSGLAVDKLCAKVIYNISDPFRTSYVDAELTKEINQNYNMSDNAGKATVKTVDPASIATYKKAFNALKSHIEKNTLPIGQGKQPFKLIPLKRFNDFNTKLGDLLIQAEDARKEFLREYAKPEWIEGQRIRLGDKFDKYKDTYPSMQEVEEGLSISAHCEPFASSENIEKYAFVLDQDSMASMKKAFNSQNDKIKDFAVKSLWSGILTTLRDVYDVLSKEHGSGKGSIFRDTFIPKVKEMIESLPALNFDGDTEVERLRKELVQIFSEVDNASMRKDPKKRKETADKVAKLRESVASYASA